MSPKSLPRVKRREFPITQKELITLLNKVTCFSKFTTEQMVEVKRIISGRSRTCSQLCKLTMHCFKFYIHTGPRRPNN